MNIKYNLYWYLLNGTKIKLGKEVILLSNGFIRKNIWKNKIII